MAEATVLICDVCGELATKSLKIVPNGRGSTRIVDLCAADAKDILALGRPAKRGRPRKTEA
jgi:hypothetical protein